MRLLRAFARVVEATSWCLSRTCLGLKLHKLHEGMSARSTSLPPTECAASFRLSLPCGCVYYKLGEMMAGLKLTPQFLKAIEGLLRMGSFHASYVRPRHVIFPLSSGGKDNPNHVRLFDVFLFPSCKYIVMFCRPFLLTCDAYSLSTFVVVAKRSAGAGKRGVRRGGGLLHPGSGHRLSHLRPDASQRGHRPLQPCRSAAMSG